MTRLGSAAVAMLLLTSAGAAFAQPPAATQPPAVTQPPAATQPPDTWPPAPYLPDLGCAPSLTYAAPKAKARVTGALAPERRLVFAVGQTITIDAGTAGGVEPGQEYFVRRLPKRFGARGPDADHPVSVHTVGWVKILAADANTSTATILHSCDGMLVGDYLEPFAAPAAAAVLDGTFRYENLGHLVGGDEDRSSIGTSEYMVIDRGSDHGVRLGTRFVVLRDKGEGPLVEVGEGVVLQVRPETSTVQITRARSAVVAGDYVAIAK